MSASKVLNPTAIYAIWDTQLGCWWTARSRLSVKAAWVAPGFAKRSFKQQTGERFDDQTRYVLEPITRLRLDIADRNEEVITA